MERVRLNEQISVGEQPGVGELADLRQEGFESVVNLRLSGEEEQQLAPTREHEIAMNLGMKYAHIPLDSQHLEHASVDRFRAALESLPPPVYVHCRSGKRARAMALIHVAAERDLSGEQTLASAGEMGVDLGDDKLERFVRSYLDAH